MRSNEVVLITNGATSYPECRSLFRPGEHYPEYVFSDISDEGNEVYAMVRCALYTAGYDREHYGSQEWNPLGTFINIGDTVLIKPNMVREYNSGGGGTECLFTHPSVVAAMIDYTLKALKGHGHIIIGDAPVQECDFNTFLKISGYDCLIEYYNRHPQGIEIEIKDLRKISSYCKHGIHYYNSNECLEDIEVDLGKYSLFSGKDEDYYDRLRITNFSPSNLKYYHNRDHHIYSIAKEVLEADVIINIPKPKTHKKAGITASLKNMIGTTARKESVPHHTNGNPVMTIDGDQYEKPSILRVSENKIKDVMNYLSQTKKKYFEARIVRQVLRANHLLQRFFDKNQYYEGSWYKNTTISKSVADINRVILYADKTGKLHNSPQRKMLVVADMIISGEHNGPLSPEPKTVGMLVLGENSVAVDEVIGRLAGIKQDFFYSLMFAKEAHPYSLKYEGDNVKIVSDSERYDKKTLRELQENCILSFKPADGWRCAFENQYSMKA